MNFKETVVNLAEYFAEVKNLKEAGIDIIKLEAHKKLYDFALTQMIELYGFHETMAIIKNAYDNKISERDLNVLEDLVFPSKSTPEHVSAAEETFNVASNYEAPQIKENTPKYFINGEEVSAKEFDAVADKFRDGFNLRFTNDWILRNIFE